MIHKIIHHFILWYLKKHKCVFEYDGYMVCACTVSLYKNAKAAFDEHCEKVMQRAKEMLKNKKDFKEGGAE